MNNTVLLSAAAAASTCLLAAVSLFWHRERTILQTRIAKLTLEAAGERKARIRHEIAAREVKRVSEGYPTLGCIRTMFPRRYGTPRQGALAKSTIGVIDIDPKVVDGASALDGLDKFSFAWLVFIFHENTNEHKNAKGKDNFKAKVKAPGLLGLKTGILATRTPHRPSRIGLSLVKVVRIENNRLVVSGVDLLDGTPIVDIKPYVPMDLPWEQPVRYPEWVEKSCKEGDSLAEAPIDVQFDPQALLELREVAKMSKQASFFSSFEHCQEVVTQTLSLDFRAVHHGRYGEGKQQYQKMKLRFCDFVLYFDIHTATEEEVAQQGKKRNTVIVNRVAFEEPDDKEEEMVIE